MSRTMLAAMRKYPDANAFVKNFLRPCIRRRKVPFVKNLPEFDKIPLGKGGMNQINFADKENPSRVCFFTIQRTFLHGKAPKLPAAVLSMFLRAEIKESDWKKGAKIGGTNSFEHTRGSKSEHLLIPEECIGRWPFIERSFRGEKKKYYLLSHDLFEELNESIELGKNTQIFCSLIECLRGKITSQHFFNQTRVGRLNLNADPLKAFLSVSKPHHTLFIKIIEARNKAEIAAAMGAHFKVSRSFAESQAKTIWEFLENNPKRKLLAVHLLSELKK